MVSEDGKSVFWKDTTPGRSTVLQWMTPRLREEHTAVPGLHENKDMKLEPGAGRGIRGEYEQNTLIEILTVYKDGIVIKIEITKVFRSQRNLV